MVFLCRNSLCTTLSRAPRPVAERVLGVCHGAAVGADNQPAVRRHQPDLGADVDPHLQLVGVLAYASSDFYFFVFLFTLVADAILLHCSYH